MPAEQVFSVNGDPGTTIKHTAGDTVETLDDVTGFLFAIVSGQKKRVAVGALVTVETNGIRYAFGADPTQGAAGLGHHVAAGGSVHLVGPKQVRDFRFINHTNSSDALLQITPEHNTGGA